MKTPKSKTLGVGCFYGFHMLSKFPKDAAFAAVAFLLVAGSVTLAVIDPATRPAFIDLTKVMVGVYVGQYFPTPRQH